MDKVYQVVYGRPLGPSWQVYLDKNEAIEEVEVINADPFNYFGCWLEEKSFDQVALEYADYLRKVLETPLMPDPLKIVRSESDRFKRHPSN